MEPPNRPLLISPPIRNATQYSSDDLLVLIGRVAKEELPTPLPHPVLVEVGYHFRNPSVTGFALSSERIFPMMRLLLPPPPQAFDHGELARVAAEGFIWLREAQNGRMSEFIMRPPDYYAWAEALPIRVSEFPLTVTKDLTPPVDAWFRNSDSDPALPPEGRRIGQ